MCLFKLRCIDFSEVTCEKKGSTRDPDFDFPDHDNFNFLANVRKRIAHHDDNSNLRNGLITMTIMMTMMLMIADG